MEKYFAAGFGLLIGLVGLYVCFAQLRNLVSIKSWKQTKGKIIERGTFSVEQANVGSSAFQHFPLIKYAYQVENTQFINDSIFPKHIQYSPRGKIIWAEKQTQKFPDEITVYYNPENPNDSFIQFPSKNIFYVIGVISLIVILYSIFVLIFGVDHWVGRFK